jgi:hypothetical protein
MSLATGGQTAPGRHPDEMGVISKGKEDRIYPEKELENKRALYKTKKARWFTKTPSRFITGPSAKPPRKG